MAPDPLLPMPPDAATEPEYPISIIWRNEFTSFLNEARVFTRFPFDPTGAYFAGQSVEIRARAVAERYTNLPLGSFCTIGTGSYSISALHPGTTIGRFCSIGAGVVLMDHAHPMDRVTTSPLTYNPIFDAFAKLDHNAGFCHQPFDGIFASPVTIDHDVWIGAEALLAGGIRIGTGAVIGARSIVTRDVPPYAVVAGSPARIRRMRFSERCVDRLLASRWWDYNFFQLPTCWLDTGRFLDELESGVETGAISVFDAKPIDIGAALSAIDRQSGPAT